MMLRRAALSDIDTVYVWRNHQYVRQYTFNPDPIPYENHKIWFEKAVLSEEIVLLIAESEETPVGVLRFDIYKETADISLYLDPNKIGQGLGKELLQESIHWAKQFLPQIKRLVGKVSPLNLSSKRIFEGAGFSISYLNFEIKNE